MKRPLAVCLTTILAFVAAKTVKAAEADKPAPEPKLAIVNVSSHCDWTWKHSRAWHEERYAETIRQVLLLMRKHPNYVWQIENENEQLAPFLKKARKQWPELVDEFWEQVSAVGEQVSGGQNPETQDLKPGTWKKRKVNSDRIAELVAERSSTAVKAALNDLLSAPAPTGGSKRRSRKRGGAA